MHHVFVDFENVQVIDLRPIGDDPVEVTVLVGAKQKPPKSSLLQDLLEHAGDVRLVKMHASGKNALDMVLASQLGMALARDPTGRFHIISQDKDFDPLVTHLRRAHFQVDRLDEDSAEPSAKPPKPAAMREPAPVGGPEKRPAAAPTARPAMTADRVAIMEQYLRDSGLRRPKSKTKLLQVIKNRFGNRPTEPELTKIVDSLARRRTISIDAKDRVTYPFGD